ncbi:MAG: hypothetical protein NTX35_22480 [Verrucomicrobia bacterium]|nr:hypothetical protein [Verrucomicrobiota bacterium]
MNPRRPLLLSLLLAIVLAVSITAHAQVPQIIHYQSRVAVGSVNFEGSGLFKFALVNTNGSTTYWSNDGTSTAGSQPTAAVTLPVSKGLYSVHLGDSSLTNMTAIPASVFANADVRLRVWFNDGTNGSQLLTPDHRIAAVGYAMVAGALQSGADINAGAVTATTFSGNGAGLSGVAGALPWVVVSGTSQQAVANTGYVASNPAEVTVTLPASPAVGDIVRVSGVGAGGWRIAQNAGQSVTAGIISLPGSSWTARESNRYWSCVASSADGTKLVAGTNGGQLYTSADSGITWVPRENTRNWSGVASSSDGSKLVGVANNGQIYTSIDSGLTWTARATVSAWTCVASSSDGSKLVAGVDGGKIYTSTDSGVSWAERLSGFSLWYFPGSPPEGRPSVASSSDGTRIVAVISGGGNTAIHWSADSGVNWTPVMDSMGLDWKAVAASSNGAVMVGVSDRIRVSTDGGSTWAAQFGPGSWNGVACSADGKKMVAVSSSAVHTSTDSGYTWVRRAVDSSSGFTGQCVASSADGTKLVAGSAGGPIFTSTTATTSGSTGFLSGGQFSAVELQHIGNGQFMPISSAGTIKPY